MVLEGPDLERNKVVRWRCADLQVENRVPLVCQPGRAYGGQAATPASHDPAATAPLSSEERRSRPGDF